VRLVLDVVGSASTIKSSSCFLYAFEIRRSTTALRCTYLPVWRVTRASINGQTPMVARRRPQFAIYDSYNLDISAAAV
jgi:hypothetical protein